MRIARVCFVAVLLSPALLIVPGCTSGDAGNPGGPGDTSKAYKSSDDALKEMQKQNTLPQKR